MQLKDYLDKYGITIRAFAARVGCTPPTIHHILNNRYDIRLGMAIQIEKLTDNQVSVYDLAEKVQRRDFRRKNLKSLDKKEEE